MLVSKLQSNQPENQQPTTKPVQLPVLVLELEQLELELVLVLVLQYYAY
jgi:hypothetical protein